MVYSETASIVCRTRAVHSACCLQPSFRKTDCSSTHVLCLCGGLGELCSLAAASSRLVSAAASLAAITLASQRPGTVELFVVPQAIDFSRVCTLFFNSATFCSSVTFFAIFCIGVTSHQCDSLDSVSAQTWFSHSSFPSPSTPRPSWTCTCTRRGPLNVERAVECSSLRFRAFCRLGFLACGLLRLAHTVSIIALLLVILGYSLAFTSF